jgi:carbon-monoxide dehydrogenase iron sulfur subunit
MSTKFRKLIVCDPDKCNGCEVCAYICSIFREKTTNWKKSRIRIVRIEPIINMAITCRKCEKPDCVRACPYDAISQDESTGIIAIDKDKCSGCSWCMESCKFGAIRYHLKDRIAITCDFCKELDEPKCVEYCPKKALTYTIVDQIALESCKTTVEKLFAELEIAKSFTQTKTK